MTDAGTPSGHCNELIPARRNPLSWLVNLHQIGTSVLPTNLIHPTAYTVVVYQVQGSSCASCTLRLACTPFSLFVLVQKRFAGNNTAVWSLSRLVFSSRAALGAHYSYRSLLCRSPPLSRRRRLHDAYFLFHMTPSWIKCFRQLVAVSFRGQYRGSSVVPTKHYLLMFTAGGRAFPKL